ncbi:MAG: tRNA dihydrouridine synthase DusB [Planctomycetes bacterium]|nr:tRNA dihydrouridine synthase DusB [Planctomycetota bacterium]
MPSELKTNAEPPLRIGNRVLPSRYFLSPLAGYTHLAFRRAVRELGGLGLATTDLVQATLLLSQTRKSMELIATTPDDRPLSIQIYSGLEDELVRAARWLEEHGYEGIDINMGCPMAKINGQGGGARLMCDVDRAARMVAAVVAAVRLPVTVKMRLGWDERSITAPELARMCERVGVAAVTVHARTRQQGFRGRAHWQGIRAVVEAVETIPVVGNGDVRTVEDAFRMRQETGCAAVAIGRGAILDPWIFRKIQQAEQGHRPTEPSATEQIDFLVRHFRLMTEQHGAYSCVLFRKYAAWYGARLGIPEDLEARLRRLESIAQFDTIVEEIRRRHGQRRSAVPTALMKLPNGPTDRR